MSSVRKSKRSSVLVLLIVSLVILATVGLGLLTIAFGVRHRAIAIKNEAVSMLAAEAGYEKAVFWMSQQMDMLTSLYNDASGSNGTINFPDSYCDYSVSLYTFVGHRPVYKIVSNGHSGVFNRTVEVFAIQGLSGWDMGMCRIPDGPYSTQEVNFADGEIIDMPLHINNLHDSPDNRDIYIIGSPSFLREVTMGESKGGKYPPSIMALFEGGIYFDQPDSRIVDEASVASKIERFRDSTKEEYRFTPNGTAGVSNHQDAVHLEFFVQGGVGKVRITDDCTVRGHREDYNPSFDYKIKPDSDGKVFEKYPIYAYHLRPYDPGDPTIDYRIICNIEETYVTQSIGGVESRPGGQIFVNGNVVIGSADPNLPSQDEVKGQITVVATGNIWIADSLTAYGAHDADGMPSEDNPNVIGLIVQGVVKVVDPGMSTKVTVSEPYGHKYVPIGRPDPYEPWDSRKRRLPDPMVVEAFITVGGGGWGAENVYRSSSGLTGRKEYSGMQDDLVVRGIIVEAMRGVVGLVPSYYSPGDGYIKHYYFDERVMEGILPGDFWLRGKYIPAPSGWHDYRAEY